jgi:hypothetical protein
VLLKENKIPIRDIIKCIPDKDIKMKEYNIKEYINDYKTELLHIVNLYNSIDNENYWKEAIKRNDIHFFPNIKIDSNPEITSLKNDIAEDIKELTLIKYCTQETRKNAFKNNIYSWNDINLNADILRISLSKKNIVNNIIFANRDNKYFITNYEYDGIELYLDIENIYNFIYMIGVFWIENNEPKFEQYTANRNEYYKKNDKRIINKYIDLINRLKPSRIYIWGKHEINFFKKKEICTDNLFDFFKKIENDAFAIPGIFNHSLKSVGKLFFKNGWITSIWDNNILNGYDAMKDAKYRYEKNLSLDDNKNYNKMDVIIMYEIIEVFKNKILIDLLNNNQSL